MAFLKFPHLFQPLTLGKTVFRNRIFASPTGFQNGDHLNLPSKELIAYYELKALGGAASVTMGDCLVDSKNGRVTKVQFPLDDPDQKGPLGSLCKAITRHGAVASLELQHGGMYARTSGEQLGYVWGPSATMLPFRPGGSPQVKTDGTMIEVREMSEDMIEYTISRFGDAALFAKKRGFGMVMIHGGHGWLVSQFMSDKTNKRKDRWGGSLENRMRFPLAIIDDIRKKCGRDFPIEFRMSGSECYPDGYGIDEGIRFAQMLDGKVDLIHVSAGNHEIFDVFFITHPSMFHEDGCNVKYAAEIKKHVQTPVATVGALSDPAMMEEIIASGMADVVELGRETLADPDFPIKARTGRDEEINQCLRCYSCFSECDATCHFQCAINPVIGNEYETKFDIPPKIKKKVLIAGGGIAGMQAALTCADRGHEVILCEKTAELGGILLCEDQVPFKKKLKLYIEKQKRMIKKSGIEVILNTEVTKDLAEEIAPDAIIAAMGATPIKPNIPGIDNPKVLSAVDIYKNPQLAGRKVVIIGGGLVGVELGIFLSMKGSEVTILEIMPYLNYGASGVHGAFLDLKIPEYGIRVELSTKAVMIDDQGVVGEDQKGKQKKFPADTVIYAVGLKPQWERADELRQLAKEFFQIGDCLRPRNILMANQEGYYAAKDIGRF
ncbi:MAG: FAD-dependent oxidoreductase [Peptococcaceae bacterium]|jgi:2,4-dienoyl-CoA reductase-like NADH-dependent reductase (Old Yellow Enzyme family)/thioredoxin reductase|nr:FAD-dependent oxidoreductase [Peptococcaceae bacterium]